MSEDRTRNDRARRYYRRRVEAGLIELRNVWVLKEDRDEAMRRLGPLERKALRRLLALEQEEADD